MSTETTRLESLPEDCLCLVISLTSPRDACRTMAISGTFRDAADSDVVWEKFLPPDYREIMISRSVSPVEFRSKKELFEKLSATPLLIDGGKKTIAIDKYTNKKCYMLSARELSITWSTNSLCWCWKSLPTSRFAEAVELIMVSWLEIRGKMKSKMLSPKTTYGAYLVIQVVNRAFGLGTVPSKVSVEVGDYRTQRMIWMPHSISNVDECKRHHQSESLRERDDGWLEIELGEFYNDDDGSVTEKEVLMEFKEVDGQHLKGGLLVEGIELRPKH